MITISISSTDINGHDFGPDDPSQEALIVQSDALLDAFFTHLDQTIDFRNILIAVTGDHGGATSQKAGDADRMPVLEFPAELFTKPLEKMLEAKYPLKDKGADILQMDNPYLPLNREAFEAAGLSAVNTTATMLKAGVRELQRFKGHGEPSRTSSPDARLHKQADARRPIARHAVQPFDRA